MKTFIFEGDSITDAGRNYDDPLSYGYGYPVVTAARLGAAHPGDYTFADRGYSGSKITDMYERRPRVFADIKPDILVLLIGINDVWHEFLFGTGVANEEYYDIYCRYIEEVKQDFPECEIIILEPFVLKGVNTQENWDVFRREVEIRAVSAKKVAEKYNLKFIPLQKKLDNLVTEDTPAAYWLTDGVHPTIPGRGFIADEVIKAMSL